MKALHNTRRDEKQCINNKTHGKAHKGGRCKPCWDAKLAAERKGYVRKTPEPPTTTAPTPSTTTIKRR